MPETVSEAARPTPGPLDGPARVEVEEGLRAFLKGQRWFAGKARELDSVSLFDATAPGALPGASFLAVARVSYRDGGQESYLLPLGSAEGAEAERVAREGPGRIIARFEGKGGPTVVFDALAEPVACRALLDLIGEGRSIPAGSGSIRGVPTPFFEALRGPTDQPLPVIRGSVEQSNSAVFFGERLILKVFRRLEPGINPDLEIGRFLAERAHYERIPRTAGSLEYHRPGGEPIVLALLQELVANSGTGWDHALHELKGYYEEVDRRPQAPPPSTGADLSPLELAGTEPPALVTKLMGPYLKAAATLGRRTGELHLALAGASDDPAFVPEPLDAEDLKTLAGHVREQVESSLRSLRDNLERLEGSLADEARRVLDGAPELLKSLEKLPAAGIAATKIRIHGDYHLGQTLRTGDDYVLLDFEGEPARPLEERRARQSPVKDVVGMLRSFDYAAYAGLFAHLRNRTQDFGLYAPWARTWQTWASASFLDAYLRVTSGASFLPNERGQFALLLEAYTLEKVLYELLYELNNRPTWVGIPLQGVLALIEGRRTAEHPAPGPARDGRVSHEGSIAHITRISDFDLHLLAEGTHYRSYEKLGAHPGELDGAIGTAFAVWAPNARSVSVIGDFNNWDPSAHPMQPRGSAGIWERFLPGVGAGEAYQYSVISQVGERVDKADPFAFASQLRPGTASRVFDLSRLAWTDDEWMANRRASGESARPLAIYEVHLGSWMRVPEEQDRWLTYRELAPRLADYVCEMGFTHVELLPISEHPFDGSWGYQPTGYFAPTARFGSPDEFAWFVDHLHNRGIGVLLDWVPGHFPRDPHGLGEFDGTHLYEPDDPLMRVHPDWDTFTFDYGRPEVSNFLISNALFWLDLYHIDGIRVDAVASMLYLDYSRKPGAWTPNEFGGRENLNAVQFLRRFNERVHAEFPDALTIAEESTSWPMVSRPTSVGGLGFDFKWDLGWMHDTLDYLAKDPVYRKHHHDRLTFRRLYAFSDNFVLPLSHDEVVHGKGSLLAKMAGDEWQKFANVRLLFGYQYTQPGKKLLFMGDEIGQWREWNHDSSLDWDVLQDPRHQGLRRWVRDLNTTYRGEPALHELDCHPSGFDWVDCCDSEQSVISYLRRAKSNESVVLVACNFTPVPRHNYRLGVPHAGFWEEILNSDATIYGGGGQGNIGGASTTPVFNQGHPQSLNLTLPPLAIVALRWAPPARHR